MDINVQLGKFKKKYFWWIKSNSPENPPAPINVDNVFFLTIVLLFFFQFLDIVIH